MSRYPELAGRKTVELVRVSSKKQARQNDKGEWNIPAQDQMLLDFILEEELVLIRKFVETGSAYKRTTDEREVMVDILEMAKNKEFEVLVVYKLDRIGRKTLDSPMWIQQLYSYGIIIVSYQRNEGIVQLNSPMDSVRLVMEFWKNETYSEDMSKRSNDYQVQIVQAGKYRGGGRKNKYAYGYDLVYGQVVNNKGKYTSDVVINQDEAEVLKLIWYLSYYKDYGCRLIARYLNENGHTGEDGKKWCYSSINYILTNPIYKGYFHVEDKKRKEQIISIHRPDLVIIPEGMFDANLEKKQHRSTPHNGNKTGVPNKKLLNGLVYCGYCGSKLASWNNHRTYINANGERKKTIFQYYRCRAEYNSSGIYCEGQKTYSSSKLDPLVERQTIELIAELAGRSFSTDFLDEAGDGVKQIETKLKNKEKQLFHAQSELKALKKQIAKVLDGTSKFSEDDLAEQIQDSKDEIEKLLLEIDEISGQLKQEKLSVNEYSYLNNSLKNWVQLYKSVGVEEKRTLLGQVIDRIDVSKDNIEITYKISVVKFMEKSIPDNLGNNDKSSNNGDSNESNCVVLPSNLVEQAVRRDYKTITITKKIWWNNFILH